MKSIDCLERASGGRSGARSSRRDGGVTCEIYGLKQKNVTGSVELKDFEAIKGADLYTVPFEVNVGDKKERVICRAVQWHPVSGVPLHIDFLRVDDSSSVATRVPIVFENLEESPALKAKATLHVMLRFVRVRVDGASALPEKALLDMKEVQPGRILHTEDLVFSKPVKILDAGKTVAKLIPARVKAS